MRSENVSHIKAHIIAGGLVEAFNAIAFVIYDSYADRIVTSNVKPDVPVYAKLVEAARNYGRR